MMKDIQSAGFRRLSKDELYSMGFDPFSRIDRQWSLLTACNDRGCNTMTVSWGFAGIMWGKPCFMAVVRPQRYTREFLDDSEHFTMSFLPEEHRDALKYCGSHSGRDVDKFAETGLSPVSVGVTAAVAQAELVFVCKKLYEHPFVSEGFCDPGLDKANYAAGDYHIQFVGEIEEVWVRE